MTAADYPITFGYGAKDDVYYYVPTATKPKTANWLGNYHRGDDRAMPYGTSVVVNGVTIGKSGNGNGRYGAHLHVGKFVNGLDVNPGGGGFSLDGARVIGVVNDYATDPVNAKNVRIQDASGAQWVYLHMSEINVTVGQALTNGGEDMGQIEELQKQVKDLQARVDLAVAQATDANRRADGLQSSLEGERKGYQALLDAYNALKAATSGNTAAQKLDQIRAIVNS